ncbi:putative ubiquitin-conjugating enzyme [Aspergillus saccharolyticus JOP 1030-1]|uniref:Ubiquitin-conjugating enzyme n=1 Tax=Aspergillus saccharolyticus JOP 1030-1 TaxID=1450539 RepID=A0A318ZG53_9EURO|nr:ubiquitin-conjugating enzyme [Aspergillus saccharolyticus JOP 1030-1]PYH45697.1 ubiquitin-conjugating enzyme [Aspergillus saccharolyticus JOP 1030-1]
MSTTRLPNIPSLRKQQLLLEFASLQHAAPPGTYVSLSPGDPTLWSGVIFVRSGPYASAVLRFQIRFPDSYPNMPPMVNFATDLFHPLIVPLTTYTFSTGASTEDPVSATDDERLPPGGFSLRHGFPHWFGRAKRGGANPSTASSRAVSVRNSTISNTTGGGGGKRPDTPASKGLGPDKDHESTPTSPTAPSIDETEPTSPLVDGRPTKPRKTVPVAVLLEYIRSTFDDADVLDSLPLEAAANPSAWHAWKAHRKGNAGSATITTAGISVESMKKAGSPQARLPGDWHWDGIWVRRVQSEIEASVSDLTLYGAPRGGTDEMIRFSRMDDASLASVKEKIISTEEGDA